jgi:hypothetical protein
MPGDVDSLARCGGDPFRFQLPAQQVQVGLAEVRRAGPAQRSLCGRRRQLR